MSLVKLQATMNQNRREILISGYIRNIEREITLSSHIPSCVIDIIVYHYPLQFKFHYPLKEREKMKISDDGLSFFKNLTTAWTGIRFGDFINKSEGIIVEIVFELKKISPGNAGFGFVSSKYVEREDGERFNFGKNHTLSVTGAGFMVTTIEDFRINYIMGGWMNHQFEGFWKQGDKVHIQIDMISGKGRQWNDNNKEKIFEVEKLPDSVAIFADLGVSSAEINVVSQTFKYKL